MLPLAVIAYFNSWKSLKDGRCQEVCYALRFAIQNLDTGRLVTVNCNVGHRSHRPLEM